MKYITGFREPRAAAAITRRILELRRKAQDGGPVRVMEVCGSHTMAIGKYGIRGLVADALDLGSGPGCPVCVTDAGYIDAALRLAARGAAIYTFGDMLKVPGSASSLAAERAGGAEINVCYSPREALQAAADAPGKEIVFLAVGFETTIAPILSVLEQAAALDLKNLSFLTAFKTVVPAMRALAADPAVRIHGFLCPAHVSAMIGAAAYEEIAQGFALPCVIAGFEPLDILLALQGILEQLARGEARVDNQYSRVVTREGNRKAWSLIERYLAPADASWRGIGVIDQSGLGLRREYARWDAAARHGILVASGSAAPGCRCGEVLKGMIKPTECGLFARACTPEQAVGPCMVSSEGTCSAYYKYGSVQA